MGLQSALTTALTGLQAAETSIDVVGNNVANSNTVGFKESNVLFATQFLQTTSIGSSPTASSGGTNPRQIGLGVKVAEIAPDFTQGTIEVSSNPLDLAVQGDGFFIVAGPQSATQEFYTRNGQLKTNSQNEIVTVTGHRVLGYGVNDEFQVQEGLLEPLSIPFGASAVAQDTNEVTLVGNLIPTGDVAGNPSIIESSVLMNDSIVFPTDLAPTDLQQVAASSISATSAANAPASGVIDNGTYSYRVVFVDPTALAGNDEAPPSAAFGTVTVDGTQSVDLSSLPTSPDPATYTAKRIYRTDALGEYRLLAEIPAGQLAYTDNTTNAALGASLNNDSLDTTDYSYFVTFYNNSPPLESRPTSESATISVSEFNRRIRLDNLPTTASPDFSELRIYRSVDDSPGNFYLVDTVPLGTTTYIDNTPDSVIEAGGVLLDRNGPPVTAGVSLLDVATFDGSNYVPLFTEGTLQFTGTKGINGGLELAPKELEITATTTVQNLIDFMEQALGILQSSPDPDNPLTGSPGGALTSDGRIKFESNQGIHNAVSIDQSAFQLLTASGVQAVPITFSETQPAVGDGSSTEMIVFDSLGIPMTVRMTTVLESKGSGLTTYRWYANSADNQPANGVDTTVGTGLITFGSQGQFVSATDTTVAIERRDVASDSPVVFDLDFSTVTALEQGNSSNVQMQSQDGFPAGTLTSFSITESGRIKGVYSNGVTRDLGQIVMARFANNGGLQQVGDNLWSQGVNSGEPLRGFPGAGGLGSLTAGAVELSNTDIGQNLIELILASTQYRGGTRVITSAQELLDELLNLRR